jgi:hypothetical protein
MLERSGEKETSCINVLASSVNIYFPGKNQQKERKKEKKNAINFDALTDDAINMGGLFAV